MDKLLMFSFVLLNSEIEAGSERKKEPQRIKKRAPAFSVGEL